MDVIVICGGLGTRVREITNDEIPKILIPVNGKPFIEYLIEVLYAKGARNIVFACGFKADVLEKYLFEKRYGIPWPQLYVVKEEGALDTGGAVLNALRNTLAVQTNPFLVINGDCLVLPDLSEDSYEDIYYNETPYKVDCAMFTCYKEHDGRYGSLRLAPYNPFSGGYEEIVGFENNQPGQTWINCGWYIMRHEFFREYKEVQKLSIEKDIFPKYLGEGKTISAVTVGEGRFTEIGTPEAIQEAKDKLLEFFTYDYIELPDPRLTGVRGPLPVL